MYFLKRVKSITLTYRILPQIFSTFCEINVNRVVEPYLKKRKPKKELVDLKLAKHNETNCNQTKNIL